MTHNTLPKLRWPLELQRVIQQGQPCYVIRDPQGLLKDPILLPHVLMLLASRFDGQLTLSQHVAAAAQLGLPAGVVETLVRDLDSHNLLDTPRTAELWHGVKRDFATAPVRALALAGLVYPSDREQLRKELTTYIDSAAAPVLPSALSLAALAAPHIDYRRGHQTYGATYHALKNAERPDVIILIGTSHQPGQGRFHASRKGFETGFGILPSCAPGIETLAKLYGETRLFADEILHKKEHSLELQLPFIGLRYRSEGLPQIIPILVGSFHDCVESGREPQLDSEIGDFIAALAEAVKSLEANGKRVMFYAGVDLAHVGRHFGDQDAVAPGKLPLIERRDRELLEAVAAGDAAALFRHIAEDQDGRRICGFPSFYTMLKVMAECQLSAAGRLIEYRQAVDSAQDCTVTFAGIYWERSKVSPL